MRNKILLLLLFLFVVGSGFSQIPMHYRRGLKVDTLWNQGHTTLDSSLTVGTDFSVSGVVSFDSILSVDSLYVNTGARIGTALTTVDLTVEDDVGITGDVSIGGTCGITGKTTTNWIESDSLTAQRVITNKISLDTVSIGGGTNVIKIITGTSKPEFNGSADFIHTVGGGFDENSLIFVSFSGMTGNLADIPTSKISSNGTLTLDYATAGDTITAKTGLENYLIIEAVQDTLFE